MTNLPIGERSIYRQKFEILGPTFTAEAKLSPGWLEGGVNYSWLVEFLFAVYEHYSSPLLSLPDGLGNCQALLGLAEDGVGVLVHH